MDGASVQRLENLWDLTLDENETETAKEIYEFIAENTGDEIVRLNATLNLIDIQLLDGDDKRFQSIEKEFKTLIEQHGYRPQTLQLQVAYANFLTFKIFF